ncbi:MAG: cystathionine gamma-synthase [Candidatus Marinimicrobia bacterium]|nr:cystathionine gamma-synthase [Candidatus Neomarinimicrobiota bacterium]
MSKKNKNFSTKAIHVGQNPEKLYGAVSLPIYLTSTFKQEEFGEYEYDYSRAGNPTRTNLEENIASLENGKGAVAFSSGMGAISAVIHLLSAGDEVIFTRNVYGGTYRIMEKIYKNFSINSHWVDTTNLEVLEKTISKKTKMIYIETPTNPMMEICDINAISKISKKYNCILVVDNTFMSPYNQRPIELGADIVMHSITKYLNGHSDVIGGILITNKESLLEKLRFIQMSVGSVPSPFDCWIVQRSLKTLHVRMDRHNSNANEIANYLEQNNKVVSIYYPGLKNHPNHEIAKKQQLNPSGDSVFGGMISIDLGSIKNARTFVKNLEIFTLAESLGGVESLVCHPATMTHASIPENIRNDLGITQGLVRLSVGIEDVNDLVGDIDQAINRF